MLRCSFIMITYQHNDCLRLDMLFVIIWEKKKVGRLLPKLEGEKTKEDVCMIDKDRMQLDNVNLFR